MYRPFRAKIFIYLVPRAVALGYLLSALLGFSSFDPHPLSIILLKRIGSNRLPTAIDGARLRTYTQSPTGVGSYQNS